MDRKRRPKRRLKGSIIAVFVGVAVKSGFLIIKSDFRYFAVQRVGINFDEQADSVEGIAMLHGGIGVTMAKTARLFVDGQISPLFAGISVND